MAASYTEAIAYLEKNYERAMEKGIAGSNLFEKYCLEKGILPTEKELEENEEFAYDWILAIYYNQPDMLKKMPKNLVPEIVRTAIKHSAGDDGMQDMIADILTA